MDLQRENKCVEIRTSSSSRLWAIVSPLLLLSMSACSSAAPTHSETTAASEKQLQEATKQREELKKQLAQVPTERQDRCAMRSGECLVLVGERREKLFETHALDACREPAEIDARVSCAVDQLLKAGKAGEVAEYFAFENWCTLKLLSCAVILEEEAIAAAKRARSEQRKVDIETSAAGILVWNAVEATKEKVNYVRATLPPAADGLCKSASESARCNKDVTALLGEFQLSLDAEEDQFEQSHSTQLYENAKRAEASCHSTELECLSRELPAYAETPETRRHLQRNFEILDRRQQLIGQVAAEDSSECLMEAQSNHQGKIVNAYQIYVKQPVLYFRSQLHKAFFAMHEAQVACLRSKSQTAGR